MGRYLSLTGQLTEGRIAPTAFERRVKSWRPVTILDPPGFRGQVQFLSDPVAVFALAEIERGEERESWIDTGRGAHLHGAVDDCHPLLRVVPVGAWSSRDEASRSELSVLRSAASAVALFRAAAQPPCAGA